MSNLNILDKFRLDGKVALVTGCSRGIGMAFAEALAEAGASVGLMDADILNPNVPTMTGLGYGRPKVTADRG